MFAEPLPGYCAGERKCTENFRGVCGTDGLLYKGQCDVGVKSCGTDNDHLDVAYGKDCFDGKLILICCLLDGLCKYTHDFKSMFGIKF